IINDVLWQLGVLAYNLTIWMRCLCRRKSWRQKPNTFRNWFIRVAGRLVYHSRLYKVKLRKYYYYRKDWLMIYDKIAYLVPKLNLGTRIIIEGA
ncbi:MAG: transposase, partial [Candidatus Marinimicrobia bacterium]|nr:transposase [Candidatus Neomarinimicrobiota bacterium]